MHVDNQSKNYNQSTLIELMLGSYLVRFWLVKGDQNHKIFEIDFCFGKKRFVIWG
jgi:hypothetical protein